MVLHGYCDHNRRNAKNVQAKLVALEKVRSGSLLNKRTLSLAPTAQPSTDASDPSLWPDRNCAIGRSVGA